MIYTVVLWTIIIVYKQLNVYVDKKQLQNFFVLVEVPTLAKLMNEDNDNDNDEEFTTKKWSLLFWVLHTDFDDYIRLKIRSLPRDLIPVVLTVLFLLWVIDSVIDLKKY